MTYRILIVAIAGILSSCSPKTAEQSTQTQTQTQPQQPVQPVVDNPCATFDEAPNPDLALENFVLYRDFLRTKEWDLAFGYWQKVYKDAPAADGKRSTVFTDGVKFYEHFMQQDTGRKQEYIQKIFELYDKMQTCYPEGGLVTGMKAFDYFYKYPELKTKEELYELFKTSIEQDGGMPRYFVINPFTSLLVDLVLDEKLPMEEAKEYAKLIFDSIEKGLAECEDEECEGWKVVAEYAPARLEALESLEGFFDCTYYADKYYPEFEANPTDCEAIVRTYSRMKWGGCQDDEPRFAAVKTAYLQNCYQAPTSPVEACNNFLGDGEYRKAVNCYEELLQNMTDNAQKAQINLIIAKIYFAYLKNFPKARQYARTAASLRPGWGEPYLLIGTLYASSGPLCGPGRGWDSQVVVWPAIDMWNKAKQVDPSVAREANKYIAQYSQYMPSKEDIFQRLLKEGDTYFVPCWIQESTVIRAAP